LRRPWEVTGRESECASITLAQTPLLMCRIFGYLGSSRSVRELLLTPAHALVHQARRPRELPPGTVGSDGYGFAWYTPASASPGWYRSTLPIWADENLPNIGSHLQSGCVLASVRSATAGMPVSVPNTPPHVRGAISLVHNGQLEGFADHWMTRIRTELPIKVQSSIVGNSDSEHLMAVLTAELGDEVVTSDRLDHATRKLVERCAAWSGELGRPALLNMIISDGTTLVATRSAFGGDCPSLYVWQRQGDSIAAVIVASEPTFDDPGWEPVPMGTLLIAERRGDVRISRLPG
jgi:ergothioneine biosynthesis protein EgtC